MAEPPKQDGTPQGAIAGEAKLPKKQNPVFRMMGLPNLPKRLPSRNWLIFWAVLASFTAAKTYDTRRRKAAQKKWCDLVAHVSQESMPVNQMPRKLTVYLAAMPGDGIGPSRQYFKDYVKPVLVAASMDYEVIEGRKEGDVRYGTAEQIRRLRRKRGERGTSTDEPEMDPAMAVDLTREKLFILPEPGVRGDLVLGRHTWKEYIRGLHEGWLGPLDEPDESEKSESVSTAASPGDSDNDPTDSETKIVEKQADENKEEEKKKPYPPPAYLPINGYAAAPLSPHTPSILEPSGPIHQQHLLGFLKTPQRIWNFLNRRKLADDVGRQTAAIVLAHYRPYQHDQSFVTTSGDGELEQPAMATKAPENDAIVAETANTYEQQGILEAEERYWHKSVRKPKKGGDEAERVWLHDTVLDPRIANRMRRFQLDPGEEERATRIGSGLEQSKAIPVHDLHNDKITIGNIDDD